MTDSLILEIIDGPMDGLQCKIDKEVKIGRNAGNTLPLPFDVLASSRHAEIALEGQSWCIRDLGSTNGTYHNDKELEPETGYPIREGQLILIGETAIEILKDVPGDTSSDVSDSGLEDPRNIYKMTDSLSDFWERLYNSIQDKGLYCDVSILFKGLIDHVAGKNSVKRYSCVSQICSVNKYEILGSWISARIDFNADYKLMPGVLSIAPRVWRVMDLAADQEKNAISPEHVLKGIVKEGRSLAARYIALDDSFRKSLKTGFGDDKKSSAGKEKTTRVLKPKSDTKPRVIRTNRGADQKTVKRTPSPKQFKARRNDETWYNFGLSIERIVLGFIKDAVSPVARRRETYLPGKGTSLNEILASGENDRIQAYLKDLYKYLLAVLVAQRDSYSVFAEQLCAKIEDSLDDTKDRQSGILARGKAKSEQEFVQAINATLTKCESEGLSEQVMREKLRENIRNLVKSAQRKQK